MERYIIHQVRITQRGQRELFQIRIPRICKRITGVKVTTDSISSDYQNIQVGWLWLSLPIVREAFFSQIVKSFHPMHDWAGYSGLMPVNFMDGYASTGGTKQEFLSVNVPVYQTLVEGYYSNEFATSSVYTVSIYLRLEL